MTAPNLPTRTTGLDRLAEFLDQATVAGQQVELTVRVGPVARENTRRVPLQARYVGSRSMSPTEVALARQLAMAPQTFTRQGVVPARRPRSLFAVALGIVASPLVMFGVLTALLGVAAAAALTSAFVVVVLALLLRRRRPPPGGGNGHCPGAWHR